MGVANRMDSGNPGISRRSFLSIATLGSAGIFGGFGAANAAVIYNDPIQTYHLGASSILRLSHTSASSVFNLIFKYKFEDQSHVYLKRTFEILHDDNKTLIRALEFIPSMEGDRTPGSKGDSHLPSRGAIRMYGQDGLMFSNEDTTYDKFREMFVLLPYKKDRGNQYYARISKELYTLNPFSYTGAQMELGILYIRD